jgi:phage-related protein
MVMGKQEVNFYRTEDGRCPIEDFLNSLPGKAGQKVVWVLKLIEDLEMILATYFKKLEATEGIWECRVQFGSNAYRLLGFFSGDGKLILAHGFSKKSQQTPKNEIERAETYKRDFARRSTKP